ncbi:MAG: OmpH family outer membrane protein [Acidobacteriaceae bacterium]|jgi:outer membrane protein|nr:OmpH family outer membrane protein [Acidobacteriaceae bacterium]
MNRTLSTLSTLALALSVSAFAQTAPTSVSPAPAPAPPAPVATPAKVALIAFQEAVFATNEGQAKTAEIQRKYEPVKAKIETLNNEVESLKKQLDGGKLSDDEKASTARTLETKTKDLQHEGENAETNYNGDLGDAFNKLAVKLYPVAQKYAADHGFTLLLNETQAQGQLPMIMWAADGQDVTRAVIEAYNTQSGVAAPPPASPTPHRSAAPATHTAPRPATTPKPAATTGK